MSDIPKGTTESPYLGKVYECKICKYITPKRTFYERHLETLKHLTNVSENNRKHTCVCGKMFSHNQSCWYHKKRCKQALQLKTNTLLKTDEGSKTFEYIAEADVPSESEEQFAVSKATASMVEMPMDVIMGMINGFQSAITENTKVMEMMKETITASSFGTTNHNTMNNTNHFNLNVYLNETCKDAVDLIDFANNVTVQLSDLEYTAANGYVEGITQIFKNNFSVIKVHLRPLHCSDAKREVIYVKENGVWVKDDDKHSKLLQAIRIVGRKNIQQIAEWQKAYPNYNKSSSKQSDSYQLMLSNAMCGSTEEETNRNYSKIISNIAKETAIQKTKTITSHI